MALVDRAKNMILTPATEWPVVAAEPATASSILSGYVVPLALITPICSLISSFVFLHRSIVFALVSAVITFVLEIVAVYVLAFIADALAPSFGAQKDPVAAMKWVAYSSTPSWVAGVFQLIPVFGGLIAIVGALYALYVLYLGAVPVMRVAPDKAVGYTLVVIVIDIVLYFLIGMCVALLMGIFFAGAALTSGALGR